MMETEKRWVWTPDAGVNINCGISLVSSLHIVPAEGPSSFPYVHSLKQKMLKGWLVAMPPVFCIRHNKKSYTLLDGHHRFCAADISGIKDIPVLWVKDTLAYNNYVELNDIERLDVEEGILGVCPFVFPWQSAIKKTISGVKPPRNQIISG